MVEDGVWLEEGKHRATFLKDEFQDPDVGGVFSVCCDYH